MGARHRMGATVGSLALVLTLAVGFGSGAVRAEETHTVEEGDTLQSLAEVHGVSLDDLAAANGLDPSADVSAGEELVIPRETAADPGPAGNGTIIAGVPAYRQSRSLSCEFASVYIATAVFGAPIEENDSLANTPLADNPHVGFRGDIDGDWGSTDDYGIYAEALVPHLEEHGFVGEVSYGAEAGTLEAHLDAGHPTIVWIAIRGDTGFYDEDVNGNAFKLVPYEHVVVAYGYDDAGVDIVDPGTGDYTHLSWAWFLDAWSVMDGMALAVYPD